MKHIKGGVMLILLARLALAVLANAVGLLMAGFILDGFNVTGVAFVAAVAIFTIVQVIVDPLITKIALTSVPALRGGVALVTTFISLLITSLVSSGIQIDGATTWVLATLVVWLFSLVGTLLLPLVLFKKTLEKAKS
jgi:putative membrane protein